MKTIEIKRGDTALEFLDRLTVDSILVDLAGAAVKFVLRNAEDGSEAFRRVAEVLPSPGTGPSVRYRPVAEDTETAGDYLAEWEVTFADGKILTFPGKGYIKITIAEDLG